MRHPLNLVLENWEYLTFYLTLWEEKVQQPILAIRGGRRPFEGYPEITR